MPFNELRKDYLLNRWVVIAIERSRRPTDFSKQKAGAEKAAVCPLCVGNEHMTPPAVMLYLKENGEIKKAKDPLDGERPKNWLVRTIPNLYPAFSPPQHSSDLMESLKTSVYRPAIGHHEVLVESPNHDESPADADLSQLELLIDAYVDRLKELSAKPYIKYVSIFRNYGKEAGASLSHAHSQIIATSIVPLTIQEESAASEKYYKKNNRCAFCDILEQESKTQRLIHENKDFIVLAPYASINPMEFWIIPKNHSANIIDLSQSEKSSFARILKASLGDLKNLVNDPPYNYGIHLSINDDAKNYYHWHLEVYPKLSIWAGFEKSTGIYINTITPETAAAELRKNFRIL